MGSSEIGRLETEASILVEIPVDRRPTGSRTYAHVTRAPPARRVRAPYTNNGIDSSVIVEGRRRRRGEGARAHSLPATSKSGFFDIQPEECRVAVMWLQIELSQVLSLRLQLARRQPPSRDLPFPSRLAISETVTSRCFGE
ncbi:unnamed protein product [Plutella xylostella]|uniref:(diamondback moth) hypothetical protein n=1 Tax=Plutella xylostella TaxID=51655 RepID=A0A8S4CV19_PLUXY|nr:unnamed protein product [Plutella xylostella]